MPVLAARRIEVVPVVWTEPLPPKLDALVLRSTWDYHLRLPEFLAWVDAAEASRLPLLNPPSTIRWNVDKKYLLEVEARGVPIVPTRHAARGSAVELPSLLGAAGWTEAVVKPSVSGGAFETWRAGTGEADARASPGSWRRWTASYSRSCRSCSRKGSGRCSSSVTGTATRS